MAAGLSIHQENLAQFEQAFDYAVVEFTGKTQFDPVIEHDGSLAVEFMDIQTADLRTQQVWGAGFPAPTFVDSFRVVHQRVIKEKHLKLRVEREGLIFDAIWFNQNQPLHDQIEMAYRLDVNHWNGQSQLQLMVEFAQ